jgi:endogenous inhibitor of DNA gyrase (YacG/DUF329 family)
VQWSENNPYRPFCSKRCQLLDLGAWANEEYRVPAENLSPDGLDQIDTDDHGSSA